MLLGQNFSILDLRILVCTPILSISPNYQNNWAKSRNWPVYFRITFLENYSNQRFFSMCLCVPVSQANADEISES
jgi:hypothetical protein